MSISSSSVYWNVWRLVQQVSGGIDSQANASTRHRRLRAKAYATLLDLEDEPYPDIPDDQRELANAQAATEELLRLRTEGRHGTATRITWRLDELAQLQYQYHRGDSTIPRVISFLLRLRRLGRGDHISSTGGGALASGTAAAMPCTTSTMLASFNAATTAASDPAFNALQTAVSLSITGIVEAPNGCNSAGQTTATVSSAAPSTAAFDGVPVGQRLRLMPPPRVVTASHLEPVMTFPSSPRLPAPAPHLGALAAGGLSGGVCPESLAAAMARGGDGTTDSDPALTSWFPFRDCAGLPLQPAFNAPLDELLLQQEYPDLWNHGSAMAPQSLRQLTAGAASSGGGAADAAAAPAGEGPSVVPLMLGPLNQSLVHTRFHHLNPLLLRLSGTQSECFRLPVGDAAVAADGRPGGDGDATEANGDLAVLQNGDRPVVLDLPVPFALAALGVGRENRSPGVFLPLAVASQRLNSTPLASPPMVATASGRHRRVPGVFLPPPPPNSGLAAIIAADGALARVGGAAWFRSQREGSGGDIVVQTVPGRSSGIKVTRTPPALAGTDSYYAVAAAAGRSAAEDDILLYDMAVMGLQGVASALWMLRSGAIRWHRMRLSSQSRLLAQLCDTGELRLRLGTFATAYGTYGPASQGVDGGQHDEVLAAFSDAVRDLLVLYDRELQGLAAWHRSGISTTPGGVGAATYGKTKMGGGNYCYATPFSSLFGDPKLADVTCKEATAGPAPGPDGGAGRGGGLLGLLLCLAPLRVHLQRLADVCMCVPDPAWIPPHTQGPTAAARARVGALRDEVVATTALRTAVPQLAPSLWQVYGFPQGPELLDRLYGALLQTDHAKTPLLRLLFTAACMPYVRRMRAWLYDPLEGGAAATPPIPPTSPAFTAPLQRLLTAAGLQMRLLEELSGDLGNIAARFRSMAAAEAEEAQLIAQQYDEALTSTSSSSSSSVGKVSASAPAAVSAGSAATAAAGSTGSQSVALLPGMPGIGLLGDDGGMTGGSGRRGSYGGKGAIATSSGGGTGPAGDEFSYPLVFGLEALQQLSEAAAAAAATRDSELTSLLTMLDRRRQAVAEASDQRTLAAMQASLAEAEAARIAKAAAAQEMRLARSRLLAEQRAEMDERAARGRAERERRIAEEQSLAAEAVLREHNEAAAALAAELARLRASYGGASYSEGGAAAVSAGVLLADERATEAAARLRRCEWREARMALATRRRLLWQGIQADELAQLRKVVAAARSAQAAAPLLKEDDPGGANTAGAAMIAEGGNAQPVREPDGGAGNRSLYDTARAPPSPPRPPGLLVLPPSPREGDAAMTLCSVQSSPAVTPRHGGGTPEIPTGGAAAPSLHILGEFPVAFSPRAIMSPRRSNRGSPSIVAHVARPRRATFHDSGPSVASLSPDGGLAAAASGATGTMSGMPSPALRTRISEGGGTALRTPLRDLGQRPMGHHPGSARRSHSLTGQVAFSAAMSPSTSVPAAWNTRPEGAILGGPSDPWARVTGTPQGGFLRPASPGAGGRQGPPRGYMPSVWSNTGRGPTGRVGAAGGLLLELQSRQSRRRWALPETVGGAAPGAMHSLAQSLQSVGAHYEDVEASLRREQMEGYPGGVGGGATDATNDAFDAACHGTQTGVLPATDVAAVAVWAAVWQQGTGAVPGAASAVEGVPGYASNAMSYTGQTDGGVSSLAQPRRRALWKVPSVATTGAATGALNETTSAVGVLPSTVSAAASTSVLNQATRFHQSFSPPRNPHDNGLDGWRDPLKALLREYMSDPRVTRHIRVACTTPLRATTTAAAVADAQCQSPHHSHGTQRDTSDAIDPNQRAELFDTRDTSLSRPRRAPLSEDLAYAPVGVAVQTCLYGTVLAQYRLTTRAVWHVLVYEYRLLQYCEALRQFFFCEAGDVAGALADSLTRRAEARPHVPPSTAELRAMLDEALQGCSMVAAAAAANVARQRSDAAGSTTATACSGDGAYSAGGTAAPASGCGGLGRVLGGGSSDEAARVVQLLRVRSVPRRNLGTGSYFASDVLYVTSQVPRPLDAVITPDCLRDYADVFSLLLRVCCAASVLTACWSRLNAATGPLVALELGGDRLRRRHLRGGHGSIAAAVTIGLHPLWQKRLAIARLWLQAVLQVVGLLRQHLQVELQAQCWVGLASALGGPSPQDLIQMREAHFRYLAAAREVCMLPPREACGPNPGAISPGKTSAQAGSGAQATSSSISKNPQHHHQQQQQFYHYHYQQQHELQRHQSLPGPLLMDVLQCSAALAGVLRRALTALEAHASSSSESSVLSAPPRQPTVSPVLSAVSCAVQAGGAADVAGGDDPEKVWRDSVADMAANDLDELWAHVVVCQGRLGRALAALHGALRRMGAGGEAGAGTGLLSEMAAVLSAEPLCVYGGGRSAAELV
ncbi:hypothetical protein VaNZ11_003400 [Volvox africanus]|uniref:Gamma tubulin complex component C-terminal domain-containing protein n=1 Tax=Volvox africanus TaxID=51714 RepID=A0ABQ5RU37_9CHLO|nr:hypothetical protein VaNZ11_003400 [Volvox africanus]